MFQAERRLWSCTPEVVLSPKMPDSVISAEHVAEKCVARQVAALTVGPEYNAHFVRMYKIFILQLREVVPPSTHLPTAYEAGGDDEQAFVQNLALFFTAFFRVRCLVEKTGLLEG